MRQPVEDSSQNPARLRGQHERLLKAMSHDLRTPLVALLLQAQLLERSLEPDDPNRRRTSIVIAMANEVATVIDHLVEAGRLECGIVKPELEQVALPELVRDVLQRSFPPARIQFTAEAAIPAVVVDPVRIEKALATIIDRALRASSASVSIEVSRRGQEVLFAVRDQASPVASAGDQFFERAGPAIFLAKVIVEVHGGRIWIEPSPGQGNTTTVALPLVSADRPIVGGTDAGSHGSTTRRRSGSRDGRSA
jgi:signal transduction histidine kinase